MIDLVWFLLRREPLFMVFINFVGRRRSIVWGFLGFWLFSDYFIIESRFLNARCLWNGFGTYNFYLVRHFAVFFRRIGEVNLLWIILMLWWLCAHRSRHYISLDHFRCPFIVGVWNLILMTVILKRHECFREIFLIWKYYCH